MRRLPPPPEPCRKRGVILTAYEDGRKRFRVFPVDDGVTSEPASGTSDANASPGTSDAIVPIAPPPFGIQIRTESRIRAD